MHARVSTTPTPCSMIEETCLERGQTHLSCSRSKRGAVHDSANFKLINRYSSLERNSRLTRKTSCRTAVARFAASQSTSARAFEYVLHFIQTHTVLPHLHKCLSWCAFGCTSVPACRIFRVSSAALPKVQESFCLVCASWYVIIQRIRVDLSIRHLSCY